jgi:hypothetical protein
VIDFEAPDSRHPEVPGHLSARQVLPDYLEDWDDAKIVQWVKSFVRDVELHELDEFFRVDGVLLNDPHAEDKT